MGPFSRPQITIFGFQSEGHRYNLVSRCLPATRRALARPLHVIFPVAIRVCLPKVDTGFGIKTHVKSKT